MIVKKMLYALGLVCLSLSPPSFSWNAIGHRVIAQIAYDHMTNKAISIFNHYNRAVDPTRRPPSLVNSAVWLDRLYSHDLKSLKLIHYIDSPYSTDGSPLPQLQVMNAVWAITMATNLLLNGDASDLEKGIALRILLHVVGDIHQPLHAITQISQRFPAGDKGGNLVRLRKNAVASNLHSYWDKGAGSLVSKTYCRPAKIKKMAQQIEKRWPCEANAVDRNPTHWAQESYDFAVNTVYKLPPDDVLDKEYQSSAHRLADQRLALAGCRLAELLNRLAR